MRTYVQRRGLVEADARLRGPREPTGPAGHRRAHHDASTSTTRSPSCGPAGSPPRSPTSPRSAPIMKPFSGVAVPTIGDVRPTTPRSRPARATAHASRSIDTGIDGALRGDGWLTGYPAGHARTTRRRTPTTSTSTRSTPTRRRVPRLLRRPRHVRGRRRRAGRADRRHHDVPRAGTGGTGSEIEVACAMIRAVRDGAQIVNLSLGTQTQYDQPSLAIGRRARRRPRDRARAGRGRADRRRGRQLRRHHADLAGRVPPGGLGRRAHGRPAPERLLEPRLVGRLLRRRRGHPVDVRRGRAVPRLHRATPRRSPPTRSPAGAGRRSRPRRWPGPSRGSCTSGDSAARQAYVQLLATGRAAAGLRPDVRHPAGGVNVLGTVPHRAP